MKNAIQAFAPGKLILLGEYAVLEGAPALVAAVNRVARVEVETAPAESPLVSAPTLGIHRQPWAVDAAGRVVLPGAGTALREKLAFFRAAIQRVWPALPHPLPAAHITLDTGDFYLAESGEKLGFGSSAALTVALLQALYRRSGASDPPAYELFRQALRAHYQAQGKMGSGVDIAASVFGGVLQYQIPPGDPLNAMIEPLELPGELLMLVIWAGKPASTRELIGRVHAWRQREPQQYRRVMTHLADLSFAGCHAVINEEIGRFLEIVAQYCQTLGELGDLCGAPILSSEHAAIRDIVTAEGAVYKPSGAGGGDLGIALATEGTVLERVAARLAIAQYPVIDVKVAHEGAAPQPGTGEWDG